MKFNVSFDLRGPAGTIYDIPNTGNPISSIGMSYVLDELANELDTLPGHVIGIKITEVTEDDDVQSN